MYECALDDVYLELRGPEAVACRWERCTCFDARAFVQFDYAHLHVQMRALNFCLYAILAMKNPCT